MALNIGEQMTITVTQLGTDKYVASMNGTTIKTLSEKIETKKTDRKEITINIKDKSSTQFTKRKSLLRSDFPGRLEINDLTQLRLEGNINLLEDNKIYQVKII